MFSSATLHSLSERFSPGGLVEREGVIWKTLVAHCYGHQTLDGCPASALLQQRRLTPRLQGCPVGYRLSRHLCVSSPPTDTRTVPPAFSREPPSPVSVTPGSSSLS